MKFTTLIALVGVASAYQHCGCTSAKEEVEPMPEAPRRGCAGAGFARGGMRGGRKGLSGLLDASESLPAAS